MPDIDAAALRGLIERLEKATGPDRELDALLAATVTPDVFDAPGFAPKRPVPPFRLDDRHENTIRFDDGGIMDMRFFPPVTGSLDAITALIGMVLPDAIWTIEPDLFNIHVPMPHDVVTYQGSLNQRDGKCTAVCGCLALLRALEARAG